MDDTEFNAIGECIINEYALKHLNLTPTIEDAMAVLEKDENIPMAWSLASGPGVYINGVRRAQSVVNVRNMAVQEKASSKILDRLLAMLPNRCCSTCNRPLELDFNAPVIGAYLYILYKIDIETAKKAVEPIEQSLGRGYWWIGHIITRINPPERDPEFDSSMAAHESMYVWLCEKSGKENLILLESHDSDDRFDELRRILIQRGGIEKFEKVKHLRVNSHFGVWDYKIEHFHEEEKLGW